MYYVHLLHFKTSFEYNTMQITEYDSKSLSSTVENSISFLTSNKGKPLLIYNEYVFKCNKTGSTKKYWICSETGCSVFLHTTLEDRFVSIKGEHDHMNHSDMLESKMLKQKMKDRILAETTSITKIYDEEISKAQLLDEDVAQFPTVVEYRMCSH